MIASVLIGLTALVAVSLCSALFLFAHLTGRIRRSTALGLAALAATVGGAIASDGAMGNAVFGPMAVPFGVFLMLAAGVNGLLAYQASKR